MKCLVLGGWAISSAGRAAPLQGEGRRFEPLIAHQNHPINLLKASKREIENH